MANNCDCESNIISRKDLQIFRGTYAEVMKQPTVNMKIYLAWDTQQIFVGNNHGIKTPYSGQYKAVIENYITELKDEIYDSIDSKISAQVQEALKDIESTVTESLTEIFKDQIKELVSENTKEYQDQIDANSTKIANLQNSLSQSKTETDDKISSLEKLVAANETSVSTLESKITGLSNKVSSSMQFKSGSDITQMATDIDSFSPVFCTTTYGNYKVGRIYYVENGEIKEMAGGGGGDDSSDKTIVDAGLSLSISPTTTRVAMGSASDVMNFVITPKVGNKDIIKEYTLYNTTYAKDALPSNILVLLDTNYVNASTGKPAKQTIDVKFSATTIDGTDTIKYTANAVSKRIETYQPWFFGNDDDLVEYDGENVSEFRANVKVGVPVYLYATVNTLKFTADGYGVEPDSIETTTHSFGQVGKELTATYVRYNFGEMNDSFEMVIEKKK